ncbi:hypothetical protein [Rhodopirellula sp. P2]|uniref:hypothetical protein n=1 Tax=Rhodopirellula sp. P2 TaxID=2127060 RepID=UPI0023675A82|nr:hypothetical protein [Rhodopirellula sp. P2]WDQ15268.1 hypothetical protein PSR62_16665 [Rhodopirellula sp. P2]
MELTAHSIPKRRQAKSLALESLISTVAILSVLFGVLAAVAVLIVVGFPAIATSLSILVGSLLNWLFFQSLSEIIRLLKKIAKIDYAGSISGNHMEMVLTCSHCDATLRNDVYCDQCGARLIPPSE